MTRSKADRRRLKAKAEAKRLSRFHRDLEGGLPPKAVVGPLERLWRDGRITDEQFWVGTRFAGAYEAMLPASLLRAGSAECEAGESADQIRHIERTRLGAKYRAALVHLRAFGRAHRLRRGIHTVMLAAAVHKMGLEAIDEKLQKRKQWSREQLIIGLILLVDLWHSDIEAARTQAEASGSTLV